MAYPFNCGLNLKSVTFVLCYYFSRIHIRLPVCLAINGTRDALDWLRLYKHNRLLLNCMLIKPTVLKPNAIFLVWSFICCITNSPKLNGGCRITISRALRKVRYVPYSFHDTHFPHRKSYRLQLHQKKRRTKKFSIDNFQW
jgi:hypothetical protein